MPDSTENISIEESTINSVTFTPSGGYFGARTYIEMEPGYWRSLYDNSGGVFSDSIDIDASITEYFANRFAGEDLPEHPGSGQGDGTGDGTGGGGNDDGGGGGLPPEGGKAEAA